jgi:hypothetical protein
MKPIRLPARYTAVITEREYSLRAGMEMVDKFRQRATAVMTAAVAVEDLIVSVLLKSLLREVREHRELVASLILNSDWCSFSAKRKLLFASIKQFSLMNGSEAEQLNKGFGHVMRYRNAFAHGSIQYDGSQYVLKYFEGEPRVAELNDVYWELLEQRINDTWDALNDLYVKQSSDG